MSIRPRDAWKHVAGFTIDHSDAVLCEWWATVRAVARQAARPIGVADAWVLVRRRLKQHVYSLWTASAQREPS